MDDIELVTFLWQVLWTVILHFIVETFTQKKAYLLNYFCNCPSNQFHATWMFLDKFSYWFGDIWERHNPLDKKHVRFENTPRRSPNIHIMVSLPVSPSVKSFTKTTGFLIDPSSSIRQKTPVKQFLTWWPWPLTLTFDLDLQTWPRYPSTWPTHHKSGLYVSPFCCESGNRQTHDVRTITPVADAGCNKLNKPSLIWSRHSMPYCVLVHTATGLHGQCKMDREQYLQTQSCYVLFLNSHLS